LLPAPVTRLDGSLLVLRAEVVVVEHVVAAGEGPGSALERRRQPDRRKARPSKCICLGREVVPPKRDSFVSIERGRDAPCPSGPEEERFKQDAHSSLPRAPLPFESAP